MFRIKIELWNDIKALLIRSQLHNIQNKCVLLAKSQTGKIEKSNRNNQVHPQIILDNLIIVADVSL